MKKYRSVGLSVVATICCATLIGQSVFALNPYNITYSGGEPLGADNVNIDPSLATFTNLVTAGGHNYVYSPKSVEVFGDGWKEGYLFLTGRCAKFSYIKVWSSHQYDVSSNLGWTMYGSKYEVRNSIKDIVMDNVPQFTSDSATTIGVRMDDGFLMVGFGDEYVYEDSKCTQQVAGLQNFVETAPMSENKTIFVETKSHLFKNGTTESLTSGDVYYVISDIDNAQSYKILNSDLQLSPDNMYAISAENLQQNRYDGPESNMFNPIAHYIYSEYNNGSDMDGNDAHVFVKMSAEDLTDGVDIVYGFARYAGSSVGEFYAKQYVVNYVSDDNGVIVGIGDENVIAGGNPSGSSSEPSDGHKFTYWVADKDVALTNGTVIKAGEKLTPEQVKQVVVNDDITFEAIHDTGVKSPDTGASTMELDAEYIKVSLLLLSLVAMAIAVTPKLMRKKVGFNKK